MLSHSLMSDFATPWTAARFLYPWGFSRQYWSGLSCPPPRDIPNPGIEHCRRSLYCLSHQGSPRILEWVAYPFFRGSSQSRNRTGVPCIIGRFFTSWATREAQPLPSVQFSRSVVSDSATPWTAAHQGSLSITNSQSLIPILKPTKTLERRILHWQFLSLDTPSTVCRARGPEACLQALPLRLQRAACPIDASAYLRKLKLEYSKNWTTSREGSFSPLQGLEWQRLSAL